MRAKTHNRDMTITARWDAVLARDRELDGSFVYAVRSTGVYCRPSCPSRRPRRDRVVFFDRGDEARAAGFRACRRCRPDEDAAGDPWIDKIRRACAYLTSVDGHPSLATLAERVGGSPYHLQRNFKRLVGVSPREYAEASRLNKVRRGLQRGGDVTTAMVDAGYGSSSRFYERAVPKLGMLPSAYRNGGPGATIGFTIVGSPLGRLLVAATARGICAVKLGDSDAALRSELGREFNAATILEDDASLAKWTRAILTHLNDRSAKASRSMELPLDVRATAFQWQVWQALAAIPYGETRTYGDIAVAIGQPKAVRAVARACATNPVALAIPCHRVVPASGGEGGYRWGAQRKRALLAREGAGKAGRAGRAG
jgi:AraC family transcriptional regulator, regulatory protein of adaptative response / methylated-DNA-[protein]-cysteine methyltransferase